MDRNVIQFLETVYPVNRFFFFCFYGTIKLFTVVKTFAFSYFNPFLILTLKYCRIPINVILPRTG